MINSCSKNSYEQIILSTFRIDCGPHLPSWVGLGHFLVICDSLTRQTNSKTTLGVRCCCLVWFIMKLWSATQRTKTATSEWSFLDLMIPRRQNSKTTSTYEQPQLFLKWFSMRILWRPAWIGQRTCMRCQTVEGAFERKFFKTHF